MEKYQKIKVLLFVLFAWSLHKAGVNFKYQKIKTVNKYIEILWFISLKSFELPRTHFFNVSAGSDINDF